MVILSDPNNFSALKYIFSGNQCNCLYYLLIVYSFLISIFPLFSTFLLCFRYDLKKYITPLKNSQFDISVIYIVDYLKDCQYISWFLLSRFLNAFFLFFFGPSLLTPLFYPHRFWICTFFKRLPLNFYSVFNLKSKQHTNSLLLNTKRAFKYLNSVHPTLKCTFVQNLFCH